MGLLNPRTKRNFDSLLNRLKVNSRSVILLNIGAEVAKSEYQNILDYFTSYLKDGTLCLVGDCEFNTGNTDLKSLKHLSEKTRKNIFLPIEFKILGLKESVRYVNHPSLEIICFGKHARYLTRHQSLDFPYGEKSIFNDLYDLDAVYLTVGKDLTPFALKYASNTKEKVIFKNKCLYDGEIYAYLDFEFDLKNAAKEFKVQSLYEESEMLIYGEKYRYLIDHLQNTA